MSLYIHTDNQSIAPPRPDIDSAYAVKVFLDHHPGRKRPISLLAHQCGLSEQQLKNAFLNEFNEPLDQYWEKVQWTSLSH